MVVASRRPNHGSSRWPQPITASRVATPAASQGRAPRITRGGNAVGTSSSSTPSFRWR